MAQNPNWLDASDWKWVQDYMPIVCCDLVPVIVGNDSPELKKIGLIYRDTPHQGKRWCMVGGRMWRNETIVEAIGRQLQETLGPHVRFDADADRQPDFVAQYFTMNRPGHLLDPRQHAVTLAFVIPISGECTAMGEAESFEWFKPDELPAANEFGFEQHKVIAACLKRWRRK